MAAIRHQLRKLTRRHRKPEPVPPLPPNLTPDGRGAHHYFTDAARLAALKLLWEHLTPAQRKEYARHRWLTVRGSAGGKYLIYGTSTIKRIGYDITYCLTLVERDWIFPTEDHVLAKKLLLECNEPLFLRTANRDFPLMVTPDWRARDLLVEHLTSDQLRRFANHADFYAQGNRTSDIYRVTAGFVYRLRDNHRFCIGFKQKSIPWYDEMLAKKILIECDERRFLKTAVDHNNPVTIWRIFPWPAKLMWAILGLVWAANIWQHFHH